METTKRDLEKEVEARVKDELRPLDIDELYDQMLDECTEWFMGSYAPSRVLAEVDPTAYDCGKNDYFDSLSKDGNYEEIDEELYDRAEVEEIRDQIQAEIDEEEAEDEDSDEDE